MFFFFIFIIFQYHNFLLTPCLLGSDAGRVGTPIRRPDSTMKETTRWLYSSCALTASYYWYHYYSPSTAHCHAHGHRALIIMHCALLLMHRTYAYRYPTISNPWMTPVIRGKNVILLHDLLHIYCSYRI